MGKEWNEYVKVADEATAKKKSEDLSVIESNRKKTIDATTDTYNTSISNVNTSYADQYERNAVQKYINEKQIAEKNANLGLTNSGLNRTQQTAVQLSYANQRGKIDLEKQNAINTLEKELASAVATINQESDNAKLNIEQYYTQLNNANAQNMYNTDATNESNERIAKIEAENNLKLAEINSKNDYTQEYYNQVISELESKYNNYINPDDILVDENGNIIAIEGYNLKNNVSDASNTVIWHKGVTVSGFRPKKGDNFKIYMNEKKYSVENKGKVTLENTINELKKCKAENNSILTYNDNMYIKYDGNYYEIGNIEFLFIETEGKNKAISALKKDSK